MTQKKTLLEGMKLITVSDISTYFWSRIESKANSR